MRRFISALFLFFIALSTLFHSGWGAFIGIVGLVVYYLIEIDQDYATYRPWGWRDWVWYLWPKFSALAVLIILLILIAFSIRSV